VILCVNVDDLIGVYNPTSEMVVFTHLHLFSLLAKISMHERQLWCENLEIT